jgi:hypothetical protein
MSEHITAILKSTLDDLREQGEVDAETRRNRLKEELQYYVLNFVYHHPACNSWVMYGGSALRIIHGLDRMSVDLDFEVSYPVSERFLEELKENIEMHFQKTYGAGHDFLSIKMTNGRGLLLKFHVGKILALGHDSDQVHVKIDLNHFVAPKTVHERRPINRGQLSFIITTYNMSALMASKIAAVFLRGTRGVGKAVYEEKGRDIYDLLWYMNKKIVPDIDYLVAKGIDVKDPRALFDKLTLQMNKVSDENLKQDLLPLFLHRNFIENWLKNWRESYLRLLDDYKIHMVTELENVVIDGDFQTNNFDFVYWYRTENVGSVRIVYTVSFRWIKFPEGDLSITPDTELDDKIEYTGSAQGGRVALRGRLRQYATLFHEKTERYFKKTNRVMLGDEIITKVIRMTADNLNQKEEIVLNKSALLSCELDDLFR